MPAGQEIRASTEAAERSAILNEDDESYMAMLRNPIYIETMRNFNPPERMTVHRMNEACALFQHHISYAIAKRCRYLRKEMSEVMLYEKAIPYVNNLMLMVERYNIKVPRRGISDIIDEGIEITKVNGKAQAGFNKDEELRAQAMRVPITKVIEFINNKTTCPYHDDKSPSMYHAHRQNIAYCPVCGRGWNAIQILIDRDGMKYWEAVKYLCSL